MKRRRKQPTITIRPGKLLAGHIRNRAKRLGITMSTLVANAVLSAEDEALMRWLP